ncbi:MAG TPA: NAD(P)/FAD-dependent oxidoreductase [Solirubrobacterales bacterium]|nr:NAD(P)/FAD-dependent oxidoreductase [Solirubrobacterales bacterium]
MSTAIVVGAGPNGLAAAAKLARAGVEVTVIEAAEEVGGGTRSGELTRPGLIHDHCSAVHPMAAGSPAVLDLELERHGLEWCWPEVDLAHPLDGGRGGLLVRSIEETAASLGEDGHAWRRLFARPADGFDQLNEDLVEPILHVPKHPLRLARFGIPAAMPASLLVRGFDTGEAAALFGGVAAHAFSRLDRPMSSAVGMALIVACHAGGWPVARGGSRAITDAMAASLREAGGRIETGRRIESLGEVAAADAVVFDLAPRHIVEIAGDRLPARTLRAYERYRHGPGAFKVDLAVEAGIPWADDDCRRAGTVHAMGSFAELADAERQINAGRMPERPNVLVGQQYLADPTRSAGDLHPIWAYGHVPSGYDGDATEAVLGQIERFAPGLRERIAETVTRSPAEFQDYNPNYIGGDIITGANTPWQMAVRPRPTLDPYFTGAKGLYICSAATPPGAGVHGMGGYNAARSVLKRL